jgi:hypothetical protein
MDMIAGEEASSNESISVMVVVSEKIVRMNSTRNRQSRMKLVSKSGLQKDPFEWSKTSRSSAGWLRRLTLVPLV